jgi:similar to stage IV sporulation protein
LVRLERLVSFLTGYVEVLVRGAQLEKLLNLLTNSGLYLWDVKRLGNGVIQLKIRSYGFLRIRRLIRRTHSTVRIYRKRGWPFIRRKLGRRKMFWIGAVAFMTLLFYLSSLVLFIKVDGFAGGERKLLLTNLSGLGLKPGITRQDLLAKKSLIEREVMMHTPGAVWLGITVQGVVAEVKVVKRKIAPAPLGGCDIIAAHDGVISKLVVVRGVPVVKEGDTVARGDLLISGVEWLKDSESENLVKYEVSASGIVEAKTWYDLEAIEPKTIWRPVVKTARYKEYKLRWGRRLWHLGGIGKKPAGNYYWVRWHRHLYQGRNPFDSVELIKDTWQAVNWRRMVRSRREIEETARTEINNKLKVLNVSRNNSSLTWSEEGNFVKLTLTCEKQEDIAMISPRTERGY